MGRCEEVVRGLSCGDGTDEGDGTGFRSGTSFFFSENRCLIDVLCRTSGAGGSTTGATIIGDSSGTGVRGTGVYVRGCKVISGIGSSSSSLSDSYSKWCSGVRSRSETY